ncbi:hypothetical protein [Nocardioides sp. AE5]|uniref:hypothetical protein n=1 Tax=Nocardioides sp. AE5 TaxID=2962573 RepID=UPI002881D5A4|nr:hypothetical protein [Nocardioides sp. AE5]MDT0201752.1 hypothetical protein [Nocardioides sp. AE5]
MRSRVLKVLLVLVVVTGAVLTGVLVGVRERAAPAQDGPVVGVAARAVTSLDRDREAARRVLAEWDRRRAAAWAAGDLVALRDLYVDGSAAGERDAERLAAWQERGLRVEEIAIQVLEFELVSRTSEQIVIEVTDRIVGGEAVGSGQRIALPHSQAERHRVTLVLVKGEWRVS